MRVKRTLPKGVWFQPKRLATGEVVKYGYYGRGPGSQSLGREGSAEFHTALAEVLRRAPPEGSVASLIHAYRSSKAFTKLGARTQADYLKHLDRISTKFGKLSLRAMASPAIAAHIEAWRDSMDGSPRQADYATTVLKLLLAWGVAKGKLEHNRAAGLEKIYDADRSEMTWSEEQEASFLAVAPETLRRALILAVETGLSQGDALALPRSADKGHVITWRRAKTGVPVAIPVSPHLRACLNAAPKTDATTILTTLAGRPWSPNGFRAAWRAACQNASISGVTFNDLRGTFITRRRSAGWSAEVVALCSGHPIQGERGAQKAYADRAAIALASAERLFQANYADQDENEICKLACKPAAKGGS